MSASFFGQSSFATHVVCEARSAVRVEVEAGRLDLLGPLACSVQTGAGSVLFAARAGALDAVVVFGAGAVGLSAVMAAHAAGARRVVAVDVNSARLRLASELGADATVDGSAEDTSKGLRRVEPGGFDVAIDCTGSPAVMIPALRALRSTGRFFLVGVPAPGSKVDLEPGRLFGKTMTGVVQGDSYPPAGIPALVDLWSSGRLPLERLVTRFPLEAVEDAAAQMRSGAVVKPVLVP